MSDTGNHNPPARTPTVPDFTQEALAHLQVQSNEFALHVNTFLDAGSDQNRQQLCDDLHRFRNTLVLLEKGAAVYVAEELLTLLAIDAQDGLSNRDEVARVLLLAADQLTEHVSLLQRDGSLDSALPMLPLVNDSRACRDETLLSDMLVLAAGIELPQTTIVKIDEIRWQIQREEWIAQTNRTHAMLAKSLLLWWRKSKPGNARHLTPVLQQLAEFCHTREYLEVLVPLFQAASIVAMAIAKKELNDGPALRSLFAQLERNFHRSAVIESPDDLLLGDLLRNYLYYVAQIESSDPMALNLRHQFRLDRVRQAALVNETRDTPTIGVGYHLARAIRSNIATETQALRTWLDQSGASMAHPAMVRLKVRLAQLEPVLTLMGEPEALTCLQSINSELETLDETVDSDPDRRLLLAESLLTLDALLAESARYSVTRRVAPEPLTDAPADKIDGDKVFVDMATDACFRVARESLQDVGSTLGELMQAGPLSTGRCHALSQQIHCVDKALQILPLPQISPLLQGLDDILSQIQITGRSRSSPSEVAQASDARIHQEIATLLVSIDYYLGCALQPYESTDQLLADAHASLQRARDELHTREQYTGQRQKQNPDQISEQSSRVSNDSQLSSVRQLSIDKQLGSKPDAQEIDSSDEAESEQSVALFLPHMDALGGALVVYRGNEKQNSVSELKSVLKAFEHQCAASSSESLQELSSAACIWFDRLANQLFIEQRRLTGDELGLLDEVHGVIPQLIDQWLSGSESIRAFDELIGRLKQKRLPDSLLILDDANSLTLDIDDQLSMDSTADANVDKSDGRLHHVFYQECEEHLDELEHSVKSALQPSAGISQRLPTEQMLRALHTLTASAQAADAPDIVAIVQPLQRAALARQRLDETFNAKETRYIGDLLTTLRALLKSLATGEPLAPTAKSVVQELPSFLASTMPGSDAPDGGLGIAPNVRSLEDVFSEEAVELLARLHVVVNKVDADARDVSIALSLLHTLKGSARMAGCGVIAESVHSIEADVQSLSSCTEQLDGLKISHQKLDGMINQLVVSKVNTGTEVARNIPAKTSLTDSSLQVSDTAFDTLLDLATEVTVNQARLSDELARLREIYQDLETTSLRWCELSKSEKSISLTAVSEMFADMGAARAVMRSALRQAEREQQQASRASAGLQQNLIRTRLVRIDEIRERLTQIIRDAAHTMSCEAQLVVEGGELAIDRVLFRQLLAPLEHMARNAVVHGIEVPGDRISAGKQRVGKLTLNAVLDGTDLVLCFSDDGRGIDRPSINALLQTRGQQPLETHDELHKTLFTSGFSSVDSPTTLAGHGLGLTAVQLAVEQLGGQIQLASEAGVGTRITLRIPQRMVVNQLVLVDCEGSLFALPVTQVDAVHKSESTSEVPEHYQRMPLTLVMQQRANKPAYDLTQTTATVLVTVGGKSLALEVDQIVGYRELVIQALGPQLASLKRFTGGCVLSDGRQVLVVDLNRIVELLEFDRHALVQPARESLRPSALVVDDSLTMRVAAQTVLQRCGIAVSQSRDGIEALDSVAAAMPNLIVLDIEMPRLGGEDFLRRIYEKYGETCPPVIVTSSRGDEVNRERMLSLGAVRFLTKPYTESQLLEAVESAGLRLPDLTIA